VPRGGPARRGPRPEARGPGGVDLPLGVERPVRGAQQQLDAGQALGEGVVDLAGQPLALVHHSRPVLHGRQLGPRPVELEDETTPVLRLGVQGLVAEHGGDDDTGPEHGPDHHGDGEGLLVPGEPGDRHRGDEDDGGQPDRSGQEVEQEEEPRECQVDGFRAERQQRHPRDHQQREPGTRRAGRPADRGPPGADGVDDGDERRARHHPRPPFRRTDEAAHDGEDEKGRDEQVHSPTQQRRDRGRCPPVDGGGRPGREGRQVWGHRVRHITTVMRRPASIKGWSRRGALRRPTTRPRLDARPHPSRGP